MTILKLNQQTLNKLDHLITLDTMSNYCYKLSKHLIDIYVLCCGELVVGSLCVDYNTGDLRSIENERVYIYDIFLQENYNTEKTAEEFLTRVINDLIEYGYTEFSIDSNEGLDELRKRLGFVNDWEGFYVKTL